MKKSGTLVSLAAIALCIFFASCSAYNDTGSVAMTLPLNASVSRSISLSGNTPTVSQIEAYEIRVRNSDDVMVQKITDAPPGATAYIDELTPGVYTISVLAYYKASGNDGGAPTPQTFTYDCVSYYGKTTVEVFGGETKTTSLTMGSFNSTGSYPCVMIQSNAFDWNEGARHSYSCTVTGNGVNFTYTGEETAGNGNTSGYMICDNLDGIANYYWNQKKETFLEPGFTYTFDLTLTKSGWVGDEYSTLGTYKGRVSQKIEQSNYGNQYEHAITIWVN